MKKLSFYIVLVVILISCNSVERIVQNEHLLTKNIIYIDSTKSTVKELNNYLIQKPNNKTLGFPISLYFYNRGNTNKPSTPSKWNKKHTISYGIIKNIFSEKQSIAYANTFIGFNNWFLKNGEAPVIINDVKIKRTVKNLQAYYMTNGYFKSTVTSKKNTPKKSKKGFVEYFITPRKPIFLDSIFTEISSPVIDSLYKETVSKSFLKSGDQYNDTNFRNEAKRLIKLYRNSGVYQFSENLVGFYGIDTARADYKTNVLLKIKDRFIDKDGVSIKKPLKIQTIKKVNIITDYTFTKKNQPYLDSISYNGITLHAYKKVRYNPKYLLQSVFVKPNEFYSDSLRNFTRTHLKSLKNFKSINISYKELNDDELEANIYLTPIEKYTLGLKTEFARSNIKKASISGEFSINNRNTFRGTELLKLAFSGSYFDSNNGAGWEVGTDISLEIPRFIAPFGLHKLVPKDMNPRTLFSVGTSLQKNVGLNRQNFTVFADYKWDFNKKKSIQLEIFNTQYIKNLNISDYFNVYRSEYEKLNDIASVKKGINNYELEEINETLQFMREVAADNAFKTTNPIEYQNNANILNRYNILTSDFLIPTIAYTFTYNNQTNFKDTNFSFFRIRFANAGNVMGLLSKTKNANNVKTVFKIPIAQYFKLDLEYKRFWDIGNNAVFGIRSSLGVILPYEGSDVPFTKSYFVGGSNDLRAWQSYSLGPGKQNTGLEYNVGGLKFLTSAEYRFDIVGDFKGALFIDAGNIWDISKSSFVDNASKFSHLSSFQDIAIGTGFGLRYDLGFFVIRGDFGFKTYEPYLPKGQKWFSNYTFKQGVINVGINYPF